MSPSYIHDPVHGHIHLTAIEKAVIDQAAFQRLRYIRQLSLVHYVFPGGFHSRFAHSLGSCHNAGLVAKRLLPGFAVEESYPLQVFRLAALLHDVGHGAFSHVLTHLKAPEGWFLPTAGAFRQHPERWLESDEDWLATGLAGCVPADPGEPLPHEFFSLLIAVQIFAAIGEQKARGWGFALGDLARDVCSLLDPRIEASHRFYDGCRPLLAAVSPEPLDPDSLRVTLARMVAGTLDVDRMDYLARDSLGCGVNYGRFDRDGLVSALTLLPVAGKVRLALDRKRVHTLDDFLWSRFQMFRQIYCHKTALAYNILLQSAVEELCRDERISPPQSLLDYLCLTDDLVMATVFQQALQRPDRSPWSRAFASRCLPRYLGCWESHAHDPGWEQPPAEIFRRHIGGTVEGEPLSARVDTAVLRAGDDLPLVRTSNKTTGEQHLTPYLDHSVFFNLQLTAGDRLAELEQRLNRRVIFFYQAAGP